MKKNSISYHGLEGDVDPDDSQCVDVILELEYLLEGGRLPLGLSRNPDNFSLSRSS